MTKVTFSYCGTIAGNPRRPRWAHLARLNRQSEHKIRLNFPTRGTSHIIRRAIDQSIVFVISAHPSSNHWRRCTEGNFEPYRTWPYSSKSICEGIRIAVVGEICSKVKPVFNLQVTRVRSLAKSKLQSHNYRFCQYWFKSRTDFVYNVARYMYGCRTF